MNRNNQFLTKITDEEKQKLAGIEEGANKTIINNTLTSTSTTQALSARQGKTLKDDLDAHKAESVHQYEELKYSELSSIATNIDSEGIYKNIEWKRKDNTIYAKSTLIGTYPYPQIKIDYYDETGTTIIKTITWNLIYDDNDFPYTRTVI